jgi:hypothetical protein
LTCFWLCRVNPTAQLWSVRNPYRSGVDRASWWPSAPLRFLKSLCAVPTISSCESHVDNLILRWRLCFQASLQRCNFSCCLSNLLVSNSCFARLQFRGGLRYVHNPCLSSETALPSRLPSSTRTSSSCNYSVGDALAYPRIHLAVNLPLYRAPFADEPPFRFSRS